MVDWRDREKGGHMAKGIFIVALAIATVLATAGLASAGERVRVGDGGDVIHPHITHARIGERIIFKNVDAPDVHTVTAYQGDWSLNVRLQPGETTRYAFFQRGTYKFRCRIHSTLVNGVCTGMCATIKVG
jgi:plastocyanin